MYPWLGRKLKRLLVLLYFIVFIQFSLLLFLFSCKYITCTELKLIESSAWILQLHSKKFDLTFKLNASTNIWSAFKLVLGPLFWILILLFYNKWVPVFAPIHDHLLSYPHDLMFILQRRATYNPGFETYLVYDDPLSRSARSYFVLLQISSSHAPKSSFFMCEQKLYPILRAIRSSVNTQKSTSIAV